MLFVCRLAKNDPPIALLGLAGSVAYGAKIILQTLTGNKK